MPVAAEVSGTVLKVHVKNNDEVKPGQPLFDIDPTQYRIALQRSRSDYESVRLSVNASNAAVVAARASVQVGQGQPRLRPAGRRRAWSRSTRRIRARCRCAASRTRRPTASRPQSQVQAAEADLRRAQEAAGEAGEKNAQLRARARRSRRPSWT